MFPKPQSLATIALHSGYQAPLHRRIMQLHIRSEGTNNNSSLCSVACTCCLQCKCATVGRINYTGQSVSEKGHKASLVPSFTTLFAALLPSADEGNGWAWNTNLHAASGSHVGTRMNAEARHSCKGKREATAGWIPCSGLIFPRCCIQTPAVTKDRTPQCKRNMSLQRRRWREATSWQLINPVLMCLTEFK